MQKENTLFYSFIFNFIKTLNGILFPIITFAYSARILGTDGIGKVNFSKSVVSYFTMLAMLGMNYYGTREAAKRRNDREALSRFCVEMLIINGCTTILAYVLLIASLFAIPALEGYRNLLLICSGAIVLQGMGMEWLYQAMEEYRYIAVRSALFQLGALLAMFLFVRNAADVIPYAAITLVASSGSYILNFINARKYIHLYRPARYTIKKHLKPLLWLFAMAVSIELYTVLDTTMLGFLKGDTAVGLYTAAIKVERMVNTLLASVGVVLIPRLSFYISQGKIKETAGLIEKGYNYVFILSIPAAVGLFMLSDEIIQLFSGSQFASAGFTMRLLTPIVILIPFSMMTNQQTFVPMGKEKLILLSTSVGAVTNLFFNGILIPRYAENGAAAATVIAEMAVATVCLINVRRFFDMKKVLQAIWQYWLAAAVIPVVVLLIKLIKAPYIIHLVLAIPISTMLYISILYLLKNKYVNEAVLLVCKKVRGREVQKKNDTGA